MLVLLENFAWSWLRWPGGWCSGGVALWGPFPLWAVVAARLAERGGGGVGEWGRGGGGGWGRCGARQQSCCLQSPEYSEITEEQGMI